MEVVILIIMVVVSVFLTNICGERNNACRDIDDYNSLYTNKNCWYNPDVDLTVPEIIARHRYPVETYNIITKDGYKLRLFRIPYGDGKSTVHHRQPLVLLHGIFSSSAPFVVTGNNSIAMTLVNNGYDVWLANFRGSTYGKGHVWLSLNDPRYWNFSYHEMGIYDFPVILDHIYKITKRNDIIAVGQSMGTNVIFVYTSLMPDHAAKRIKLIVSLGPTIFLKGVRTPARILAPYWTIIQAASKTLKPTELLAQSPELKNIFQQLCLHSGFEVLVCETIIFLLMGFNYKELPPKELPLILAHYPAGCSMNSILHVLQGVYTGRFAQFDFGRQLNWRYYKSLTPPNYNLSQVQMPNYVMVGDGDFLSTEKDARILYNELPNKIGFYLIKGTFTHVNFFFSKHILAVVLKELLKVLKEF